MIGPPGIRLTATGVGALLARVDTLKAVYLLRIRAALEAWAVATVEKIQENHPPGGPHPPAGVEPVYGQHAYIDRTGRLTRSVGHTIESWNGSSLTLTVFALMPYAELVEYGTPRSRPYPFFWPVIWDRVPLLQAEINAVVAATMVEFGEGA